MKYGELHAGHIGMTISGEEFDGTTFTEELRQVYHHGGETIVYTLELDFVVNRGYPNERRVDAFGEPTLSGEPDWHF